MKKVILGIAILAMLSLTSCVSYKSTVSTTKVVEPKTEQLIADLKVGEDKVSGSFSIENSRYHKNRLVSEKNMVRNAIYEALSKINADAILGLQYKITTEYDYKLQIRTCTCNITGYPVWYTNLRTFEEEKTEFEVQELKAETPYVILEKNNKGDYKGYNVVRTTKLKNVIPVENPNFDKVVLTNDKKNK